MAASVIEDRVYVLGSEENISIKMKEKVIQIYGGIYLMKPASKLPHTTTALLRFLK